MKKRLFQILDDMNVADIKNKTGTVGVSKGFLGGNMTKEGSKITMGAPKSTLMDIHLGVSIPILIIVNREEYENHQKENKEIVTKM